LILKSRKLPYSPTSHVVLEYCIFPNLNSRFPFPISFFHLFIFAFSHKSFGSSAGFYHAVCSPYPCFRPLSLKHEHHMIRRARASDLCVLGRGPMARGVGACGSPRRPRNILLAAWVLSSMGIGTPEQRAMLTKRPRTKQHQSREQTQATSA
jgi:hypothetical protein